MKSVSKVTGFRKILLNIDQTNLIKQRKQPYIYQSCSQLCFTHQQVCCWSIYSCNSLFAFYKELPLLWHWFIRTISIHQLLFWFSWQEKLPCSFRQSIRLVNFLCILKHSHISSKIDWPVITIQSFSIVVKFFVHYFDVLNIVTGVAEVQ